MKNKLKKSKIIVPALALITATTVASVTGTVAWFTASRVATVTSSVFESQTLNSSMKVKTSALVGTNNATTTAAETASITVNGKLTHGSYNAQKKQTHSEGNLYVARVNGDDSSNPYVESYDDKGTEKNAETNGTAPTSEKLSSWLASYDSTAANNVWYAVAWSMEFEVTNTSTLAENSALFFDPSSTTFTDTSTDSGTKTMQGLRIALMTTENYVVVGGLATNGTETEKHVIKSGSINYQTSTNSDEKTTNTSDSANFVDSFNKTNETHYFKYGDTLAKATDAVESTLKAHTGYLGTFTSNKVTVTAVAWFEGEDSSVITSSTMSKVTASLKFYSRNIKTA